MVVDDLCVCVRLDCEFWWLDKLCSYNKLCLNSEYLRFIFDGRQAVGVCKTVATTNNCQYLLKLNHHGALDPST